MATEAIPIERKTECKGLVRKLAEVMGAVGWVEKKGVNEFHRYKYAQESDLVDALRGELAKRSVMVFPTVTDIHRTPHKVVTVKGERETQLTEIIVNWTFVDGETGEERTITVPGIGEDNVDKGFYKAFTGSEKYMLMKTFLIPTGDDPEKDSKEDLQGARERGRTDARGVAQRKIAELSAKREHTQVAPTTLFFTYPERHNGNFADFINIREYAGGLDDVAAEGLRQVFKPFLSKTKASGSSTLIPRENMPALLEKLAGECGIDVHEMRAGN